MNNLKRIYRHLESIWWLKIKRKPVEYSRRIGVTIGKGCQILDNPLTVFGSEPWLITIGDQVDITGGVRFICHEGGMWCARRIKPELMDYDLFRPIRIGNNVMVGTRTIIMPGITIGNNVIIAGCSVITKNVPDGAVVAGIPAKQISTVDSFLDNIKPDELFPTKHMTQDQKWQYLKKVRPEWFQK